MAYADALTPGKLFALGVHKQAGCLLPGRGTTETAERQRERQGQSNRLHCDAQRRIERPMADIISGNTKARPIGPL